MNDREQQTVIFCANCMNERKCYSFYPGNGKIEKYKGCVICLECYSDELTKRLINLLEGKK